MSSFASDTKSEMLILSGMILTPRKSNQKIQLKTEMKKFPNSSKQFSKLHIPCMHAQ